MPSTKLKERIPVAVKKPYKLQLQDVLNAKLAQRRRMKKSSSENNSSASLRSQARGARQERSLYTTHLQIQMFQD
nr:unnamed protein product [Callosobruchus chinensis]